ncbi:MAG: hypothetical protein R3D81_13800 [Thalassovita sp.]
MIAFSSGTKVWIAGGVTDMRCGMNSLALKVQQGLDVTACWRNLLFPRAPGRSRETALA